MPLHFSPGRTSFHPSCFLSWERSKHHFCSTYNFWSLKLQLNTGLVPTISLRQQVLQIKAYFGLSLLFLFPPFKLLFKEKIKHLKHCCLEIELLRICKLFKSCLGLCLCILVERLDLKHPRCPSSIFFPSFLKTATPHHYYRLVPLGHISLHCRIFLGFERQVEWHVFPATR